MKNKRNVFYSVIIMLAGVINFTTQGQQKNDAQEVVETKDISSSQGPNGIVRTIKQDRKGNIWITSWEGVFKYDASLPDGQGKSFTNITSKVSSARFFSVLEDRKGNFWFASIGSGVYYYDGKSFRNFTTKDGLVSDQVTTIYEDKTGTIWFGTGNGASRYDPSASLRAGSKSFRNFKIKEIPPVAQSDSVHVSVYQRPLTDNVAWMHNDVNAIMEDKTGKLWFGTRGYAYVYDGKEFTPITNNGKPFANVRSIIKDKKGNIWLGGYDGLWRYDGSTFTNFTQKFVGYIYEDKKGNIWTSSERDSSQSWALSKYDGKSLSNKKPTVTEITNKPMIFGILEDDKGNIWFGALDGVYRYDARLNDEVGQGKTITGFKSAAGQK